MNLLCKQYTIFLVHQRDSLKLVRTLKCFQNLCKLATTHSWSKNRLWSCRLLYGLCKDFNRFLLIVINRQVGFLTHTHTRSKQHTHAHTIIHTASMGFNHYRYIYGVKHGHYGMVQDIPYTMVLGNEVYIVYTSIVFE